VRHFGDLMIWDWRNLEEPLIKVTIPPGEDSGSSLSQNGNDMFRSAWLDNRMVGTGWFGGELYVVDVSGGCEKLYATKNSQKSKRKFFLSDKKTQWMKDHGVHAVSRDPGGLRVAASNGCDLYIYDIDG
jgi:hypothetical protein